MFKKIAFSISVATLLYAEPIPYTMYAQKIVSQDDTVYAYGKVMIYHDKKLYKADSAIYDIQKKSLKLLGEVTTMLNGTMTKSEGLTIKLKTKNTQGKKFFIYSGSDGIWLRGDGYKGENGIYTVRDSEVSSCDVKKPEWKILFKKAKYNKNKEFLTLHKPTFYFKDKPVFALPWFGFSTIKSRKSGFLRPLFGIQVDSGFVYMQPYFYAPYKNWDITFTPQIRSKRGVGVYNEFNFVDTPYSKGRVVFGSFFDNDSYVEEKNLKNSTHYGIDISYQSSRVFEKFLSSKESKDGLWIDFHYLNDVDYENLKSKNLLSLNKLVTSRFNYYLKRERDYFGVYAKYFIDTDKESNSDTLQELPTLEYHRFVANLPIKNMTYSFDYKIKNNYRPEGLNATWHELNLPIKLDIPLFDDYINFSFSENLYYNEIKYSNKEAAIEDARYISNYHKFVVSSDLTKPYSNFIHNIQLESSLQIPSYEYKSGDFADFININKEEKNLKLSLNQYFYDLDGFNYLTLRSSQIIYLKDSKKYGDIYNQINYYLNKNFSISENIDFSSKYNKIKKIQSNLNFNNNVYRLYLSHTYQNVPDEKKINYLTSGFNLKLDYGFKIDGSLNYDIENSLTKNWTLGLYRDKKCWNYYIKYKESTTPILTSSGPKSYKNRGLYFLVNFANIGGIEYEYAQEDISSTIK